MNFLVLVNLLIKIFQISLIPYASSDEVGWLPKVTVRRFTAGGTSAAEKKIAGT